MTLRVLVPNYKRTWTDQILRFFGRRRRLVIPIHGVNEVYEKLGSAAYLSIQCRFQGFWTALLWGRKIPRRCW
jgi:hypothetical protein